MSTLSVLNWIKPSARTIVALPLGLAVLGCSSGEIDTQAVGRVSEALEGTVTLRGNRGTVDAAWSAFKTQYVQDVTFCDGATPCKRVNRTNEGNTTVSEGIGYGMLLAAYLNDKTTFDGLWNYYRAPHHLNSRGVMHWKWEANDANSGQNEATDAIDDAAIGLIVANRRGWGSPAGTTGSTVYPDGQTYAQHATIVINKIYQFFVAPNAAPAGLPMPGDDAFWNNNTWNPSYLMAPYTAIFQTHPNSFSAAQWNGVKSAEYAMLASIDSNDASGAAVTGLVPDWNFDSGSTSNICSVINWDLLGDGTCRGGMYSYDACRTPWRLEMDHYWNNDAAANARLTKVNNWARPLNGLVVNGYKTNGAQYDNDNQYPPGEIKLVLGAFVGPLASASIKDTANTAYQQAMWNKLVSLGQIGNYYSDAQRMIALAFVSGTMPNPNNIGGTCTPASCASRGASCGSISDGCGGVVTCPTCGSGVCDQNNQCCTPTTCTAQGATCGTISNGCGGTLTCGTCGSGQSCVNNACLGLPSGWSSQDVGAVAATGSAYESGGTYTVLGSGVNIFGTADEFRFAYKSMTGDGTVIARLTGVGNTSMWAKGGVMIRETLSADSKAAFVTQWPGRQLDFQWRSTTGGTMSQLASQISSPAFRWLKLVRSGNNFSAFYSDDGTNYTQAGTTQTISMASTVFVGLAATSHNDGTLTTTTYTNVTMPGTGNISPTTSITSPASGATFTAPAGITINANASDSDGTINKVEFYQGTTLLGTDMSSPYSFSWTNVPAGSYSLTSVAYDNLNATGTSPAVPITVNPGCTLPAAPASPRATAGKGQATVSWSAVSGATSYTLRRSTTSGGPYSDVAPGLTGTSTVNTGLTNGTTYFFVVAAVNGCGTGPNSSQVTATPDASLLLHYLFNETSGTTAFDSSGNGLSATLSGATFNGGGHNSGCVDINGGTQRVNLPANVVQSCTDLTVASRVRLDTNGTNWARIFDVGTGTATNMFLTPRAGASNVLRFGFKINNATEQQISATLTFPTATWKHVAVTLLGNTGTLYVDGAQVGQNVNLTNNPSGMGATVNNFLGDSSYAADPTLDGRLDDFRISCRAYSAAEIAALVP